MRQKPDRTASSPSPGNETTAEKPAANTRPPADPANYSPERIRGEWVQLKKRAQQVWTDLGDHEFNRADGSADKLYEIIARRIGGTVEDVKAKLDSLRRT